MELEPPAVSTNKKTVPIIVAVAGLCLCLVVLVTAGVAGGLFLQSAECGTGDSTVLDEFRARTYAAGVFETPKWKESYTSAPYRLTRTWLSDSDGAVAYLDYLLYNCGHTQQDLDTYFSDESFKTVILRDYQEPELVATCQAGKTTLYMYNARFNNQDYLAYTWVTPDSDKRIIDFFMAFPSTHRQEMTQYAERLYPAIPVCR